MKTKAITAIMIMLFLASIATLAVRPVESQLPETVTTYAIYGIPIDVRVEDTGDWIQWTFDFFTHNTSNAQGGGKFAVGLIISFDGVTPAFQVHNNDGTCSAFPWGTWLYSEYDPGGGWCGWHTSEEAWSTEVSDMSSWIQAEGNMYFVSNPDGILVVRILKSALDGTFGWAVYASIAHFYADKIPYSVSVYPDDFEWCTETFETIVVYVPVQVDIKPGSYPNSINLGSKGVVPVAVLTTVDFDASTVNPASVYFAGAAPVRWVMEDVDYDGDMDMLFFFKTQGLGLTAASTEATLTGATLGGTPIQGTDTVNIVPK